MPRAATRPRGRVAGRLARILPYLLAGLLVIALTAFATAQLTRSDKPASNLGSAANLRSLRAAASGHVPPHGPPDSLAPAGAPRTWLPNYDWVLEHWLPYDQQQLFSALGITLEQVRTYFASGPKGKPVPPLSQLMQSKGLNPEQLANRLVSAWHPPRAMYSLLVSRALESFTQGHLMQHMLFHPFHDRAIDQATQQIFGVSRKQLHQDLLGGTSRLQIGNQNGRTRQQINAAIIAVLNAEQAVGIRNHVTPPSEAREEVAWQTAHISIWLAVGGPNPQQDILSLGSARARTHK
jgi:hypothetical protein